MADTPKPVPLAAALDAVAAAAAAGLPPARPAVMAPKKIRRRRRHQRHRQRGSFLTPHSLAKRMLKGKP